MSVGAPKFHFYARTTTTRWTCRDASTSLVVVFVAARTLVLDAMPALANHAIGRLALASARATTPRRSASRPGRVSAFRRRRVASRSVVASASDASSPDASARETSLPSRRLALASALGVVTGASPRAAVSPRPPLASPSPSPPLGV